jgi:hypothetical protein
MTLFPLYDSLLEEIKSTRKGKKPRDLTAPQKKALVRDIEKLDPLGTRHVLALIRSHQMYTEGDTAGISLPYNGKVGDGELAFDLMDMPVELRHVLNLFVRKHSSSMEEMKALNDARQG